MSPRDQLWERVQAALDAREDPFGDAEVLAVLALHPEELEAVLRVVDAARSVSNKTQRSHPIRAARRSRALLALGMAAAGAMLMVAWPREQRRFELIPAPDVASVLCAEFVHDDGHVLRRRSVDALSSTVIVEVAPSRFASPSEIPYRLRQTLVFHERSE